MRPFWFLLDSAAPGDHHHSPPPSYVTGAHIDKTVVAIDEDLMKGHSKTSIIWVLQISHIAANSVVDCNSSTTKRKVRDKGRSYVGM